MALVKLKPFEYFQPSSLGELLPLLEKFGSEGRIVAGGTDLVPQLKAEEVPTPKCVFDIENLDELAFIREKDGAVRIGPVVKHSVLQSSPIIRKKIPLLAEAIGHLATPQIRNVGTIGGNLCNASPCADSAPPLMVLGAELRILGPDGERMIPLEKFFSFAKITALDRKEVLAEIIVKPQPEGFGGAFMKVGRRAGHDLALASGAALIRVQQGRIEDVRIALGSVAPTTIRAKKTENYLKGRKYSEKNLTQAAEIAAAEVKPISDVRASAEYRRHAVRAIIEITLERAAAAARR
jgi:carbon-monoxide dehydrogenase medium subunit